MPFRILILVLFVARSTHGSVPLQDILENIFNYYAGYPPGSEGFVKDEQVISAEYDFIIIGAGSGGSVLANRLTEISNWRILLVEAGKDEIFLTDVPLLAPALHVTGYNWGYKTNARPKNWNGTGGYCLSMVQGRCNWPRGKAVGGTSVINFMIYTRGGRTDYDSWEAQGNPGWKYENVLPYFLKSENSRLKYSDDKYHAKGGYLDVVNSPYVSQLRAPFLQAAEEMGYAVNDYNAERLLGFSVAQANLRRGRRVSASKAFLKSVNNRENLHVSKLSRVTRIVIDSVTRTAVGVEFVKNRRKYFVKASKEVLLCAGTLNSPQLLMLSGIGPRDHLESMGIRVLEDLPVGRNLQDHVSMAGLTFLVNDSVTIVEQRLASNPVNTLNYLMKGTGPLTVPGGAEGIAFIDTKRSAPKSKFNDRKNDYEEERIFSGNEQSALFDFNSILTSLEFSLQTSVVPDSPNISLISVNPDFFKLPAPANLNPEKDDPDIELVLGLGGLTGDVSGSVRSLIGITDQVFKDIFSGYEGTDAFSIVPVLMHPRSRGRVTLKSSNPFHWPIFEANYYDDEEDLNTMVRGIKKAIELASTSPFRRFNATLLPVSFPGCRNIPFNSDMYWACVSRQFSTTLGHFVGTCKMSPRENSGVVDHQLKVHGIKRLRVVDASIMPTIIAGHTNAPTYMIGEKASDMIKQEWKGMFRRNI